VISFQRETKAYHHHNLLHGCGWFLYYKIILLNIIFCITLEKPKTYAQNQGRLILSHILSLLWFLHL